MELDRRRPGSAAKGSADWRDFGDFYQAAMEGGTLFEQTRAAPEVTTRRLDWACTGPITYCGLGLRCHPRIAWAKLQALSEGAALASKALWSRRSAA